MSDRPRLGELLVRRSLLTLEQVDQALANQVVYGGRMGTNLVELDLIDLDAVGRALSIQLGAPHATSDALNLVSDETLALLPVEACASYGLFPLRVEQGRLHLAMLEPRRADVVDQVSARLGMPVVPYACPELRLLYFLEVRLGLARPRRFVRVPDGQRRPQTERRTYLEPSVSAAQTPAFPRPRQPQADDTVRIVVGPSVETAPELPAVDVELGGMDPQPVPRATEEEPELILLDQRMTEVRRAAVTEVAAPQPSPVLAETLAVLGRATEGGEIARRLVHPLYPNVSLAVLFWVRGRMAMACCAHPSTLSTAEVQRAVVTLDDPSLLQWAWAVRSPVKSAVSGDALQRQITSFFGAPPAEEACVIPLVLHGAVINLLCVQSAQGTLLPESAFEDLRRVCVQAAEAYARLSRQIKGARGDGEP